MPGNNLQTFVQRLIVFCLLWGVLVGTDWQAWVFGAPVILIVSIWRFGPRTSAKWTFHPFQFVMFVPYFFSCSIAGSCDVAWRAMHRRLPIRPIARDYVFRLPPTSPARVCFAGSITMLPGTLTADWNGDVLTVHVLVDGPKPMLELQQLEERIGRLFGHNLTANLGSDEP